MHREQGDLEGDRVPMEQDNQPGSHRVHRSMNPEGDKDLSCTKGKTCFDS